MQRHSSKRNKKGMSAPSTLGKFILVFLLVFGLIIVYTKTMKGTTKILECSSNGGECIKGTCDWGKQVPALSDKAAGCEKGQICCINITKGESVPDPKCESKKIGTACGEGTSLNGYRCDAGNQCVTLCEFCSANSKSSDTTIAGLCKKKPTDADNFAKGGLFSCSCASTECTAAKQRDGTCIINYCPTDLGSTVCCVK